MATSGPKIAFGVLVAIGLLFTLISFFTPSWRHYKNGGDEPNFGLVTYHCGSNNNQINPSDCRQWWRSREPWEKAVIAFMVFAILFELVCLVWAILSCTSIGGSNFAPGPVLALIASLCLLISFVIFAAKNPDTVEYLPSNTNQINANHRPGYSFWLCVIAFIVMITATLVGFFAYSKHRGEGRPPTGHH